MHNVVRLLISAVITIGVSGCGEGRWIEWDSKKHPLNGISFKFTESVCYLKITPEKPYGSLHIDAALGRVIYSQQMYEESSYHRENYECEPIDPSVKFTIVASYYQFKKWWLIDAHEFRVFILEDEQKVRSTALDASLQKTTDQKINEFAEQSSLI